MGISMILRGINKSILALETRLQRPLQGAWTDCDDTLSLMYDV